MTGYFDDSDEAKQHGKRIMAWMDANFSPWKSSSKIAIHRGDEDNPRYIRDCPCDYCEGIRVKSEKINRKGIPLKNLTEEKLDEIHRGYYPPEN